RLEISVWRKDENGNGVHRIAFANGDVVEKLKSRPAGRDDRRTGTRVTAWPNPKYFDSATIPMGDLIRLLRSKAVLLPGVQVTLIVEKTGETQTWKYDQGLRGYLSETLAQTTNA